MTDSREQLSVTVVNLLRMHKLAAFSLPAPEERERLGAIRECIGDSTVAQFQVDGILVQRERLGPEYVTDGHWWSMEERAYEYLHENYERPTTTPCGCSNGIQTITAGEEYTCRNDACSETFGPDTAREVIHG
jgi:hypothetical protein